MAEEYFEFGVFSLEGAARRTRLAGSLVRLTPKAFNLLAHLVRHHDRAVSKAELKEVLWPGLDVEETNLTQTIFMLRKALRDVGADHDWVQTVPRIGYRFVPPENPRPATAPRARTIAGYGPTVPLVLIVVAVIAASGWSRGRPAEGDQRETHVTHPRSELASAAFLRGHAALKKRTASSIARAAVEFRAAISEDQSFAGAYAGLANAYVLSGVFGGLSRREATRLGMGAATEALHLNPELAESHTAMAFALRGFGERSDEAEAHYKRAIILNPDLALTHQGYALLLDSQLRSPEALREILMAVALEPLSSPINSDYGLFLAHQGLYDDAIAQFHRTIEMDPTYGDVYKELGWACAVAGRFTEAEAAFNQAESRSVPRANVLAGLGYTYARSGRADEARAAVGAIGAISMPDEGLRDGLQAMIWLGLGEQNVALNLLVRAHPDGEPSLRVSRVYDPIRNDPRFHELLRHSGLN